MTTEEEKPTVAGSQDNLPWKATIIDRLNRHPIIFVVFFLGALASIYPVASTIWRYSDNTNRPKRVPAPPGNITINGVTESTRKPVWDSESPYSDDEIIATVTGKCAIDGIAGNQFQLLAFWQVATDFETNYHVARRRVGGDYRLANLDGESALAGKWEFVLGGIEVKPQYSGAVSVVVLAMSNEAIAQFGQEWLSDSNGWGFESLPKNGRLLISVPVTFSTRANRRSP